MNRRAFVTGLGAVLAAPFAAEAQQGDRLPRMGFLSVISLSDPSLKPYFSDFRRALGDVGLVEGENITIEWRSADGNYQRLPDLAAELVRLKMDLIVASGGPPVVRAVQRATATIPIVMTTIGDPVAAGLVASLARPGGNVTGRTIVTSELVGKRLELLREVVPKLSRVAILWNPANPSGELREADVLAKTFGVRLRAVMAQSPSAIDETFAAMTREHVDGLYVVGDSMLIDERQLIADLALKRRLRAVYANRLHVEAGGLMAYGADLLDQLHGVARYIAKILKGAKPADLPVEQPTKFELVINLKTAKALGLTIPPSLLLRADQVIE
jgi:putative tryptophan/tyrosine transport system substrate-binding protein